MTTTADEIEARFAWASPRLRAWVAATFEDVSPADRAAAERAYAERRRPEHPAAWPALFAFEERFGGLVPGRGRLASAAWQFDIPHSGAISVVRIDRGLNTSNHADRTEDYASIPPEVDGLWLAQIWMHDLDHGCWIDESGAVFHVAQLSDRAYPDASSVEHMFEKEALFHATHTQRGHARGDHFLEIDGEHAEAIAAAANIPLVREASDAVSRIYWDGAFVIRERAKFGDPLGRSTQLETGDPDRLLAVACLACEIARPEIVRVIGWPNEHTYGFAKRLTAAGIANRVATTYP